MIAVYIDHTICFSMIIRLLRGLSTTPMMALPCQAPERPLLLFCWSVPGSSRTSGPILCAADSNIAVDNLVDGCAKAKLSVVRVGRPEATRTDLEQYNVLDMVKDADPDRRECDASKTQVLTRVGSYSANFARIAGFSLTLFGGRFWKTCPPMSLDVTGPCLGHPTKPGGLVYRRAF